MQYLGDFSEDSTVYIPFNTFDSNDPQASVTATTLIASDIYVHKDGSVTDIVTDGATIAIDFDGVTGNHLITIDTSVDAAYAIGSDYLVRIEGATVDAGNINAIIGSFSIENRFMRGTDSANTTVPDAAGVAPTAIEIRQEMDTNSVDLNSILTNIAALNDISTAQVNAEVVDALITDTYAELADIPGATVSLKDKITFLFMLARNKVTQTATTQTLFADNTTTSVGTSTVSDDVTTFTLGEYTDTP